MDFQPFPKISRLTRPIVITEKIDGTNAQIFIEHLGCLQGTDDDPSIDDPKFWTVVGDFAMVAGSRTQWIFPGKDNFGFAAWVEVHKEELVSLGPGQHFGEWWGSGIQRGYNLSKGEKRFSLFNTHRWTGQAPTCCHVAPVLYQGIFDTTAIDRCLADLATNGSHAAPGFMKPEGIVVFHTASGEMFKKTLEKDEQPKGQTSG